MNTRENIQLMFNKYAKRYEQQYMDVAMYHESFDIFCNEIIEKNATVLDVGCGPGNATKYLLSKRSDFTVTGIDLASKMITLAKKNNPTATFKVFNGIQLKALNTRFNAVLAAFFLPYLNKRQVQDFIKNSADVITKNGVLYLSTMEGKNSDSSLQSSSHDKADTIFINYHEAAYIKKSLLQNGFTLIYENRKTYTHRNGTPTTDLILVAKKS